MREKYENKQIKSELMIKYGLKLENKYKPSEEGGINSLLDMFFEFDVTKKIIPPRERDLNIFTNNSSTFKDFIKKKETLPLVMHGFN